MTYSLIKEGDNLTGDSGMMSCLVYKKEGEIVYEHDQKPRVGCVIRVGSHYARSYAMQDWWQTSLITEILEEKEGYVRFKTNNSIYIWRTS
jgi:hypothetical protein